MPRMLGQHELLIRLASGGAANVFLVRDTKAPPPGRLLAMKVLLPSLAVNEDFVNMFFAEAKIASRLRHPNIVAIAGFGQVQGVHCLAMEYVFGATLSQVLRQSARARKPLTVGVLLRITAATCDALHYAHELKDEQGRPMGVVHRDVTPQNILIGFNGSPKLTDFGIAKATNRGWETQAGILKGKFSYMSPEQALGKKVDRRSDIFCAGIVLWEALTGRELFKGSSPIEVLEAIQKQPIDPPSKVVKGLSPIVDPIVMKALRRSPKQRYQTALEMRDDIEELIRRANVTIDAQTISREFAEIFGDVIVQRAIALRQAMAGKADIDELAKTLGGSKLQEEQLPEMTEGGVTDDDPLHLFEQRMEPEPPPPAESKEAMPAIAEVEFTRSFPALDIDLDEAAEESKSAEYEDVHDEILAEEEVDESTGNDWDGSTRTLVPEDELLSIISEDDATIGLVPDEFSARFSMRRDSQPAEFEAERTVDASAVPRGRGGGSLDSSYSQKNPVSARTLGPLNPKKGVGGVATRPLPRAPSLDMVDEEVATPRPDLVRTRGDRTPTPAAKKDGVSKKPPDSATPPQGVKPKGRAPSEANETVGRRPPSPSQKAPAVKGADGEESPALEPTNFLERPGNGVPAKAQRPISALVHDETETESKGPDTDPPPPPLELPKPATPALAPMSALSPSALMELVQQAPVTPSPAAPIDIPIDPGPLLRGPPPPPRMGFKLTPAIAVVLGALLILAGVLIGVIFMKLFLTQS
ncbi:MAG: protein kinase [Deltaproteobacteria bacterium]|nr:protein kinase [Deltaproteobacteria bacterium]